MEAQAQTSASGAEVICWDVLPVLVALIELKKKKNFDWSTKKKSARFIIKGKRRARTKERKDRKGKEKEEEEKEKGKEENLRAHASETSSNRINFVSQRPIRI